MSEYFGGGVGLVSESLANTLSLVLLDKRGMSKVILSPFLDMVAERLSVVMGLPDFLDKSQAPLLLFFFLELFFMLLLLVILLLLLAMVVELLNLARLFPEEP